jgi:hypothetical protein
MNLKERLPFLLVERALGPVRENNALDRALCIPTVTV